MTPGEKNLALLHQTVRERDLSGQERSDFQNMLIGALSNNVLEKDWARAVRVSVEIVERERKHASVS